MDSILGPTLEALGCASGKRNEHPPDARCNDEIELSELLICDNGHGCYSDPPDSYRILLHTFRGYGIKHLAVTVVKATIAANPFMANQTAFEPPRSTDLLPRAMELQVREPRSLLLRCLSEARD